MDSLLIWTMRTLISYCKCSCSHPEGLQEGSEGQIVQTLHCLTGAEKMLISTKAKAGLIYHVKWQCDVTCWWHQEVWLEGITAFTTFTTSIHAEELLEYTQASITVLVSLQKLSFSFLSLSFRSVIWLVSRLAGRVQHSGKRECNLQKWYVQPSPATTKKMKNV